MKTVLITGASSGIGKATAEYFDHKGWKVAATMREPEKESFLNTLTNVRCYRLDVLDRQTIKSTISRVIEEFGKIDVVVNNAGYAAFGPFEAATPEQTKRQFDTNVLGLMSMTREIIPYFRAKGSGTIINISSIGGKITFPYYSLYHGTKWAVEGFSESLHFELKEFNLKVKIIEPGLIKTDFYSRSQNLVEKAGLQAYDEKFLQYVSASKQFQKRASDPVVVAKTIHQAATDNSNRLRYATGSNAFLLLTLRKLLPGSWFLAIMKGMTGM